MAEGGETPWPIPADTSATFGDVGLHATTEERLDDIERNHGRLYCHQSETTQLRSTLDQTRRELDQTRRELDQARMERDQTRMELDQTRKVEKRKVEKLRSPLETRDMERAPHTDSAVKNSARSRKKSLNDPTLEQQMDRQGKSMITTWEHHDQERYRERLAHVEYRLEDMQGSMKVMEKAIHGILQIVSPKEQEQGKEERKRFLDSFKKSEKPAGLKIGGPTSVTHTRLLDIRDLGDLSIAELCALMSGETPAFVRTSVNTDRETKNRAAGDGRKAFTDPIGSRPTERRAPRRRQRGRGAAVQSWPDFSTTSRIPASTSDWHTLPQPGEESQDEPPVRSDESSDEESCDLQKIDVC